MRALEARVYSMRRTARVIVMWDLLAWSVLRRLPRGCAVTFSANSGRTHQSKRERAEGVVHDGWQRSLSGGEERGDKAARS